MKFDHVIILGAGFSGMLTAHVLSSYYKQVTLLERDRLTTQDSRPGIPQEAHLHVLLQHGQQILEQLMPGIMADLREQELQEIDWAQDTKWFGPFGAYPQYPSDVKVLHFSRSYLNRVMFKRIAALKNVIILQGDVESLSMNDERVETIKYINETKQTCFLAGDLIIDARGRNSNASELLTRLGFSVLSPRIVKSDLGYASCVFKKTTQASSHFKQIYLQVRPGKNTKGVVISAIENKHMMVTALGLGMDKPPRDPLEFQHYLKQLPGAELQGFLAELVPAGPVNIYRNIMNRHLCFGKMKQWPAGFIVIGDAMCLLNPVYGQGMTLAARHIMFLKTELDKLRFREHDFQKKVDKLTFLPWLMAVSEDQRALESTGIAFHIRCLHRYLDKVLQLAVKNPTIHLLFLKVVHMMKSPYSLFHPLLLLRMLFNFSKEENV